MMVAFERVPKASRLRVFDDILADPELAGDQRMAVRMAREELEAIPGDVIEYVRFGGSKDDFVGVPADVGSVLREELARRTSIAEALGDRGHVDAYGVLLHGWLGGGFDHGGGYVSVRVFTRGASGPIPALPNERRMTKREERDRDLERLDRTLASGKGGPEYRAHMQASRERLVAEPVVDGEIVEVEGPANELLALLEPEICAELVSDLEERLVSVRERGDERLVAQVEDALAWIVEGRVASLPA